MEHVPPPLPAADAPPLMNGMHPFEMEHVPPPLPAAGAPPPPNALTSFIIHFITVVDVAIGVAIIVTLSIMTFGKHHPRSAPPTDLTSPTLNFTLEEFNVVMLSPNTSDLTVTYSFIIRISVAKHDNSASWYKYLSNPYIEVTIGDHITTSQIHLPPITIETPDRAKWTLNLESIIISEVDREKVNHLKELVDGEFPVPFTVMIIGEDFHHRAFNASCPASIYVYNSQPPVLSPCMVFLS